MNIQTTVPKRPHPVDVAVGKKLKELRTMRRMSQTDVAKRLGLSFQQMQKYETGSNRISSSKLFEISQFLGVSVAEFFEDVMPEVKPSKVSADSEEVVLQSGLLRMVEDLLKEQSRAAQSVFLKNVTELVKSL